MPGKKQRTNHKKGCKAEVEDQSQHGVQGRSVGAIVARGGGHQQMTKQSKGAGKKYRANHNKGCME